MGKAMIMFGFWLIVCAFMTTYQSSVSGLVPGLTLTDAIFDNNALSPYLETSPSGVTTYNSTNTALPTRSVTGTDSGAGVVYPDWTQSMFTWTTIVRPIVDFIGTPYFIFMWMSPSSDSAVFGALFSIINLVLIVGWLSGRID
jgi:hypothetical protein